MQYLYTLSSCHDDFYYEQFLLSAASLRMAMPRAQIVLLCDSVTAQTLTGKRTEHEKFVSKTITAQAPSSMSRVKVSRWVKTSMRRLVPGDFLFIDCDTIITDDLSSIFQSGIISAACLDMHSLLDRHVKRKQFIESDKKLGFTSWMSNRQYNSGVIYCADTPETHKIFNRWHELWLFSESKNITRDQPSFNMAIHENQSFFTELDGIWNCQIVYTGLPYLANSKIIHYFASNLVMHTSPFLLASHEIFKKIKETGIIPKNVTALLKNPRAAFDKEARIIAGDDMLSVINSNYFESILFMRKKLPWLFNFINRLCSLAKKIVKFFMIKTSRKKSGKIDFYN